jgi:hypothetical protein
LPHHRAVGSDEIVVSPLPTAWIEVAGDYRQVVGNADRQFRVAFATLSTTRDAIELLADRAFTVNLAVEYLELRSSAWQARLTS